MIAQDSILIKCWMPNSLPFWMLKCPIVCLFDCSNVKYQRIPLPFLTYHQSLSLSLMLESFQGMGVQFLCAVIAEKEKACCLFLFHMPCFIVPPQLCPVKDGFVPHGMAWHAPISLPLVITWVFSGNGRAILLRGHCRACYLFLLRMPCAIIHLNCALWKAVLFRKAWHSMHQQMLQCVFFHCFLFFFLSTHGGMIN